MKQWKAITKDNIEISEQYSKWNDIKNNIKSLSIINDNQIITLPENMDSYTQGKTASSVIGSGKIDIESRYIGFNYRNIYFEIRIDEKTNKITTTIKDNK